MARCSRGTVIAWRIEVTDPSELRPERGWFWYVSWYNSELLPRCSVFWGDLITSMLFFLPDDFLARLSVAWVSLRNTKSKSSLYPGQTRRDFWHWLQVGFPSSHYAGLAWIQRYELCNIYINLNSTLSTHLTATRRLATVNHLNKKWQKARPYKKYSYNE